MDLKRNVLVLLVATFVLICMASGSVMAAGMSKIPLDMEKVSKEDKDKEILRVGIIAENDAVSLYEQMAANADNPVIKKVLLDIAKEEKTHIGEFQALLMKLDKEQVEEMKKGAEEITELMEKDMD